MDWISIGRIIAPLAPVAGSILADLIPLPIPGKALIGRKLGEYIASALGVPPAQLQATIEDKLAQGKRDEVIAAINAATERARIEIEGFVAVEKATMEAISVSLTQTGETMRLELLPENRHWFYTGWRPACGWLFFGLSALFGLQLSIAAALSAFFGNPAPLKALVDAWPAFLALFAPLGLMVGVYVVARSADKAKGVDTSAVIPAQPPVRR